WRRVHENERCSYRLFLMMMRGRTRAHFSSTFTSYGIWIDSDQELKMVRRSLEPGAEGIMGKSSRSTGRECTSLDVLTLLYHMYTLGISIDVLAGNTP